MSCCPIIENPLTGYRPRDACRGLATGAQPPPDPNVLRDQRVVRSLLESVARCEDLMRQIVSRLYTFHMKCDDPEFQKEIDRWMAVAGKWDDPKLDRAFLAAIGRGGHDPEP